MKFKVRSPTGPDFLGFGNKKDLQFFKSIKYQESSGKVGLHLHDDCLHK